MAILKRFPGIGERPRERPVYGSDALNLAQRLRKDYWRQHKERGELALYNRERRRSKAHRGIPTDQPGVWGSDLAHDEERKNHEGTRLDGPARITPLI